MDGQVWWTMEWWKSLAVAGAFVQCHRFHRESCTGVPFTIVNTILECTKLGALHSQWHRCMHRCSCSCISTCTFCMHCISLHTICLYAFSRQNTCVKEFQTMNHGNEQKNAWKHTSISRQVPTYYKGPYIYHIYINFAFDTLCILYAVESKTIKCDIHFSMNVHKFAHTKIKICKIQMGCLLSFYPRLLWHSSCWKH